jgi:hypothetical protein
MDNLYIPNKLKVGFQARNDTFTKKLAYVIYYDEKGVLRKEASWNTWCDKKIPSVEYENAPTTGFMINKNVERYNWSHFSNNRSYIRIHDPRGFEFEVTPENLIGILMSGDCTRRLLEGEFVYGWHGTNLVLLPVNTEEYKKSVAFTALQGKKVSTKELTPGFTYRTKKQLEELVYLGKFDWCSNEYSGYKRKIVVKKQHVFAKELKKSEYNRRTGNMGGVDIQKMSSISSLGEIVSETQHPKFAEFMDVFNSMPEANVKFDWKFNPRNKASFKKELDAFTSPHPTSIGFLVESPSNVKAVYVNQPRNYYGQTNKQEKFQVQYRQVEISTNGLSCESPKYGYYESATNSVSVEKEKLLEMNICELQVFFKNKKHKTFNEIPYDFKRD